MGNKMPVRYVRNYSGSNTVNASGIWTEIQVIRNGENIALGIVPTPSAPLTWGVEVITDGNTDDTFYTFDSWGLTYIDIDLGQIYDDLESIKVWHYYSDGRTFLGKITLVSVDGVDWVELYNSAVTGNVPETAEGQTIPIPKIEVPVIETEFYINLDTLDVEKIFLGDTQVTNLYLGNQSLMGIPSKPQVKVTSLTNSVRLDWEVTKHSTSWNIYRSEVKGTLGEKISGGSFIKVNTITDNTVIGGTTYYYTVEAKNAVSNKATKSEQIQAIPFSVLVYENKLVDFLGYPAWQVYGTTEATADFGNEDVVQGGDRLKVDTTDRLRFELPVGMVGSANAGGIVKAKIAGKNEYTLEYEIRFDSGFPWSKGGKVPGLSGGVGYTGGSGDGARSGDGFSVRMMWREDGRIIPYLYHAKMEGDFGDTFGLTLGNFTHTKAHKVKYYVKLNTPGGANGAEGIADGILKIWLDDIEVMNKTDICYRTNESQIDTCHISIFPGGSTEDWNMTATGYIRLSYIEWK